MVDSRSRAGNVQDGTGVKPGSNAVIEIWVMSVGLSSQSGEVSTGQRYDGFSLA